MYQKSVRITLSGRFQVADETGQDLTPKGAKAQGLLALLAVDLGTSRGRRWLQDKLWSDRGQAQGAGSLRQALAEIRRSFGPHAHVLRADRTTVSLDASKITLVPTKEGHQTEFLEGIDVRDPEFENWLREERNRRSSRPVLAASNVTRIKPERPAIVFVTDRAPEPQFALLEDIFVDCVVQSLRENLSVDIYTSERPMRDTPAMHVSVHAYALPDSRVGLRARILESWSDKLLWSGKTSTKTRGAPPVEDAEIIAMGNQLVDAIADALTLPQESNHDTRDSNILVRLAIRRMFLMRADEARAADKHLELAYEMGQRGLAAAWRAQLRMIQGVEYLEQDQQRLDEEARDYSRIALEREPQNSAVLAVVANARLFYESDVSGCHELAKRSVKINPSSPLAWDSLSNAMLYTGDYQKAHHLSCYAQRIAAGSPQGYWWDLGRCLTATLTGKLDEALTYAQISHAAAPTCRATLRYLIGLYCAHNRFEQAIECANRLKAIEPEFSFDVMASNPDYPARLLQRSGLIDARKVAGLDA